MTLQIVSLASSRVSYASVVALIESKRPELADRALERLSEDYTVFSVRPLPIRRS